MDFGYIEFKHVLDLRRSLKYWNTLIAIVGLRDNATLKDGAGFIEFCIAIVGLYGRILTFYMEVRYSDFLLGMGSR